MPTQVPFVLNFADSTRQALLSTLYFIGVLLLVYLPGFSGVWMYDDGPNILKNGNVHLERIEISSVKKTLYLKHQGVDGTERIKRPLAYLSFALNWYVGKDRTFGYHLVNFSIHLIATVFLYLFLKNSLRLPIFMGRYDLWAQPVAFLAALFWSLHPIQVTAVTYIVQRMASMAGMFTIMSMYAYLRTRTAKTRSGGLCAATSCGVFALCAFATKENSAMLPVSLFAYEVLVIRGVENVEWKKVALWGTLALGVVAFLGLLYLNSRVLWDGYANRPFSPLERVLTEPRVMLYYLRLLIYPLLSEMALVHDFAVSTSLWSPWTTLPAILAVALILVMALFRLTRTHPLIAFAVIFFFTNHAIEGSFLCLEPIYEHRNYIPSMMLSIIPAFGLMHGLHVFSYTRRLQWSILVCGGLVLACMGHTTFAYNNLFRHGFVFWRNNAAKAPQMSIVQNNYAIELMKAGFNNQAFRALERAITLDRYFNRAQQGVTFHNMGLYQERIRKNDHLALVYFKKANQIVLNSPELKVALARSLMINDDLVSAEEVVDEALTLWPRDPDFLILKGKLALLQENTTEAMIYGQLARDARPGLPAGLVLWGEAYRLQGDLKKAVFFWQAYMRQRPESPIALLILSQLYDQAENWGGRERTVKAMGALKGSLSWRAWLKEVAGRTHRSASVYTIDPDVALPVIFGVLKAEATNEKLEMPPDT